MLQGEWGGPVIFEERIVGVISTGNPRDCFHSLYNVVMSMQYSHKWISDTIGVIVISEEEGTGNPNANSDHFSLRQSEI